MRVHRRRPDRRDHQRDPRPDLASPPPTRSGDGRSGFVRGGRPPRRSGREPLTPIRTSSGTFETTFARTWSRSCDDGSGTGDEERGRPRRTARHLGLVRSRRTHDRFRPSLRNLQEGTAHLQGPERIEAIVDNEDCPVQLIFAGKAHPRDEHGQAFAQKIHRLAKRPSLRGRVAILEEYDMEIGRMLTSGCDIWLNNPRRPHEASGTSGMKPPLHGGLNFSILDGWWPEDFDGRNGWVIGDESEFTRRRSRTTTTWTPCTRHWRTRSSPCSTSGTTGMSPDAGFAGPCDPSRRFRLLQHQPDGRRVRGSGVPSRTPRIHVRSTIRKVTPDALPTAGSNRIPIGMTRLSSEPTLG